MVLFIDKSLYSREALTATAYRFSGDYSVSIKSSIGNEDGYIVTIEKNGDEEIGEGVKAAFVKELTDQQVRLDIEARFGHIRDLIVEEAFKPITKR